MQQASVQKIFDWGPLSMAACGRQLHQRFLAEALSAWQTAAASVSKIFGQGPLGMVTYSRQLCWRFLAEAPLAWQPAAGKCAKDFGQGPLGMVVGRVPPQWSACHKIATTMWFSLHGVLAHLFYWYATYASLTTSMMTTVLWADIYHLVTLPHQADPCDMGHSIGKPHFCYPCTSGTLHFF